MPIILELFKGTGSVGKVFKKNGWKVISLDIEEKFNPDLRFDILDWDYKTLPVIPDFIWASPPCNTFSTLAHKLKERDTKTAEPKSERARIGTRILYKTIEIIEFFKNQNPNLKFVIENPKGMMRQDKSIKPMIRSTTLYCLYGDKRRKPTDFFSNFELELIKPKCLNHKHISISNMSSLVEKYRIPEPLIEHIFNKLIFFI